MIIALLTDFGTSDIYVGVMKGVIASINPNAQLIDLTHRIEPQNVRQAALSLMNAYRYFPPGTVFLTVVDPGVGSTRRPIAVRAGNYQFVAPDNGLLSYTLAQLGEATAVELEAPDSEISHTFHGRDVFAPAAARLAAGVPLEKLGQPLAKVIAMPFPQLSVTGRRVLGEVTHIDRFGNLTTSIGVMRWVTGERLLLKPAFGDSDAESLPISSESATVRIGQSRITGIRHTYSEAERGKLLTLVGSAGFLEISMNQANAAAALDVAIGDTVELDTRGIDATVLD